MKVLLMEPLEELYLSQHERLWKSLLAFTADPDVAAEAEAETYSQAFARGEEILNPKAWIWRTAFKVAAGILAERRSGPLPPSTTDDSLYEGSARADVHMDSSLVDFLDLLHGLSSQQRTVIVLRYAAGFKPTEIAELLDTSPGTVRVQLHRAHQHLRERIEPS